MSKALRVSREIACAGTASIVDVEQPSQSLEVKAMLPCGCLAYVEGEHSSTVACTDASLRAQLHKIPH